MKLQTMILILIFLCSITYATKEKNILEINSCNGYVDVFDRTKNKIGYSFPACGPNKDNWICDCKQAPFNITFTYNENISREYDFVVRYFIEYPYEGDNERIYSFEGIILGEVPPPPPFRFTFPSITDNNGIAIFGIAILILMFIIGIIVIFFKKILKDNDVEENEEELDKFFEKQHLK